MPYVGTAIAVSFCQDNSRIYLISTGYYLVAARLNKGISGILIMEMENKCQLMPKDVTNILH
jgi:hypothetical protein